ncbi:uncharacterized protein B0I36DRAFT_365071 [Microdochium trichocladiopsis]|uniref:Zn(2)-C6 fungal-type domain-containing protein n=1 Tax=Microdochium trichocladiopsis TaxID=1682393 RepID=A0A9P8Y139_9PEZI|nr:uncharacterized protein B0I36DRAFT_365071 [Microdochium trichocladiopsis]KAH7027943.1 hypothetical protein B0I36DRAFT_365071 [Microdochium trichocladiopsis]
MGRSAGTANSSAHRLPVNHRRHKVPPEQRKRVATACNSCNLRRIKCSGEKPCAQCKNGTRECEYPAPVEKVAVPRAEIDALRARCDQLLSCLEQVVPDAIRRHELLARAAQQSTYHPSSSEASTRATDSHEEEPGQNDGRWLADPDGTQRYLGSTSGATFLDLVKEFMRTIFPLAWPKVPNSGVEFLSSLGQYQTGDSRPLEEPDVDATVLPTKQDMSKMMTHLSFFVQDGGGDFASGGIYYWGNLDASMFDAMTFNQNTDARILRRLALFHAAFALNSQLEMPTKSSGTDEIGEVHFARAKKLLGNPLDTTNSSVGDIPVLTLMALYLIEMNRRDAAYMYVSWGIHLAVMHGVHIGGWVDEQGRRAFWTLYILDRWLSCLMGRPPCLVDDAIKLPPAQDQRGLPPSKGLKAHVELMKICGYIVCNTYRIAPNEFEGLTTSNRIERALASLSRWKANLPPELTLSDIQSYDRAACELHMIHNQLLILTIRPIFFVAVKKTVADKFIERDWSLKGHPQYQHIQDCIATARSNIKLGRWVRELSGSKKLLSQDLHHIFNAAIVLLLNQLLDDNLDAQDSLDILFVINVFKDESYGERRDYPKDCARVLEDLKVLIQRLRNQTLDDQGMRSQNMEDQAMFDANHEGSSSARANSTSAAPRRQPVVARGASSSSSSSQQQQMGQQQHPLNQGAAATAVTTAYDVGYILNQDIPQSLLTLHPQLAYNNNALYSVLHGWMDYDDFQLYNHRLG